MSATSKKIKVLIVDDHPVVRKGLGYCLAGKGSVKIVGEAADGNEALRKVRELNPDIVLMDIDMPHMDGLKVTELLRKEAPAAKVLILSKDSNREHVLRLIQAGARGYVLKEASPEEILTAIDTVFNGEAFFSPDVARTALNQYVTSGGKPSPFAQLTGREREVLGLIAEGRSNKDIANKFGISVRTIETHRERIMRKLGINNVAGLTKFAINNGLTSLGN
jgi:DNA-binding NarL/FixJ family response regulator